MPLTDSECRHAKPGTKARKLTDGSGLYLFVTPAGGKFFRFDFAFEGKRKTAGFGKYPRLTLAQARERREAYKQALSEGRDPTAQVADDRPKFDEVARDWYRTKESTWKTSYGRRIWSRIEADVLPEIGSKAVADIDPPMVLGALRKIEDRDATYTARRIHQMVSLIFKFAIASGIIKLNPAANLHVALKAVPRPVHRAALEESELPEFFARLHRYAGERQTAVALKLVAHTFVRTAEIRFGRWSELEGDLWRIPAERMKMGREHIVPLSLQSKALFAELRRFAGSSEWMLPGPRTGKPISENTLLYSLYRMGYRSRATTHGLRATASTILNESENPVWDRDAIEIALAHAPDDKIRAAYNRGERWQMRVRMAQWYSDLLDKHEKAGLAKFARLDLSDLLA